MELMVGTRHAATRLHACTRCECACAMSRKPARRTTSRELHVSSALFDEMRRAKDAERALRERVTRDMGGLENQLASS